MCLFHQRAVKGDQVRLGKQRIQIDILYEIQIFVRVHIVTEHFHTKSVADTCHCSTDFSGSDDTCGLFVEVDTHQSVQAVVVFTYFDICFVRVAVCRQSQCHRMLCNSFR